MTNHLHTRTPVVCKTVLVLVRNAEEKYSKLVMLQEGGLESTLLQTNLPKLAVIMESIEDVFVQPQFEDNINSGATVFMLGTEAVESSLSPTFT